MANEIELLDLRTDVAAPEERSALCQAFYDDVYRAAFPKLAQSESPREWLPLINADLPPPAPLLHLIVARRVGPADGGKIIGGIIIEYFRASRSALATYIAVAPEARGRGLARRLLAAAVGQATADNGGKRPLILAEVERPEAQTSAADRAQATARLGILAALGALRLEVDYVQPSLGEGKPPLDDLHLVMFAPEGPAPRSIAARDVRDFIVEFYKSLEQGGSAEQQRVLGSLDKGRVGLKALGAQ
ncbi:MAG: GNAT family N-acetyltransferase [Hyphomicrobiaceae bacterium]